MTEWESRPLKELLDAIEQHPGKRASVAWDGLRRVHTILLRNQRELLAVIQAAEQNPELGVELIQNVRPSHVRDAFYDELLQRLHNYVASVKTLVDHTRNLMHTYSKTPTGREYQQRIDELKQAEITSVVQNLRNYFLHYAVPPVGHRLEFDNQAGTETFTCTISRQAALRWSGWPPLARAYLERQGDEHISLRALVAEYSAAIEALYKWLYPQFTVLHEADIRDVNELIARTPGARRSDGSRIE